MGGVIYSDRSKMISVLPLPYEIREMIYDQLEPRVTIEPQYPVNIRQAFEPDWDPGYKTHPMYGVNTIMDDDILSRYYNQGDTAQTKYVPEKTTFRIWDKHSPLMKMHMDTFFNSNNTNNNRNCFGVKNLEYIFDCYRADHEDFFNLLIRLPNLKTLKIELHYEAGEIDGCTAEVFKDYLKLCLKLWFMCKYIRTEPSWEIQEFCVLKDEE
jgi:hypothetical protein